MNLFELGSTRSVHRRDHLLQTPDTFVRAPLEGMTNANAIIHAAPRIGARFLQYTAEFEAGGVVAPAKEQRFVYVLEGRVAIPGKGTLKPGGFAYFPPGGKLGLTAGSRARAAVIEKPFEPLTGGSAPPFLMGKESESAPEPLGGDEALEVRHLVPSDAAFDFAVNTMTYAPGAALPMVEIHVMEHGLLMLEGGGIYRLNDGWYPVAKGDFIWMGPYCPQWFGALGKVPAKYLIYKDWNRTPAL